MSEDGISYQVNIILLGDSGVGKTNMLERYFNNKFYPNYITTIGIDHREKLYNFNGDKVKIIYIDTVGQEKFNSINVHFLRNISGVIFVYEIDNKRSFDNLTFWINHVDEYNDEYSKILVGNKIDLNDQREVLAEDALNFAKENKCEFIEISAKTGENIENCFNKIAKKVYENKQKINLRRSTSSTISLTDRKSNKEKPNCCKGKKLKSKKSIDKLDKNEENDKDSKKSKDSNTENSDSNNINDNSKNKYYV